MKPTATRIVVAAFAAAVGLALALPGVSAARPAPDSAGAAPVSSARALAAISADKAANSGFDALAKGPHESFVRDDIVAGTGGLQYVSYERTYRGLPVVGGDAVVVTDSAGNIRDTVSALGHEVNVESVKPKVSGGLAAALARRQLTKVDESGAPTLVVLARAGGDRLAWEVVVDGHKGDIPSRLHVFVDAITGSIVDTRDDVRMAVGNGFYNGTVDIDTTSTSMSDPTRSGIRCGGQNGSTFTGSPPWGNGSGTNLETACVDALYAVQQEWDMLGAWLGRNGINGNGGGFPARVGLNQVNAFWNGSYTNFGHSSDNQRQATPQDVVAHEYGHAIFQTTPGGSGGGNENGGINEGTGDIFGALVEHFTNNPGDPPDYLVGEEVNLVGNGPIRNMYNPGALGDPNCWSTQIPNTEVHAAAGPLNHWFYLVAEGNNPGGGKPNSPICAGGPSSVTGIGIQKAGQVYMGALNRKTSGWRYVNVRSASMQAVVDLFGTSSPECRTVKAAWDAVRVPAQSEPQCTTGPSDDFSMNVSPTSGTVQTGAKVTTTVSTSTTAGDPQTVNLTASGLPAGVSAAFNPASVTSGGSSTLTLTATENAAIGTKAITITGTGTSTTHSATYTLTVTSLPGGDDFSVSLSPASASVPQGGSTSATVGTATTSGDPQTVNLAVTGAPTGVTASVDPTSVTSGGSAKLSISVASTTTPGTYTLTVTGTGSAAAHSATFSLTVTGDTPPGCGGLPAWGASTSYVPGDVVSHNGHKWESTWWSTGAEPGAPQSWAVWSDQGAC